MNRVLLNAVRDHLADTGHLVAVGLRPADVEGEMPYAVLYDTNSTFEDDDVQSVDRAGDHLVHVQVWGATYDSSGMLAQALDDRMSVNGITPVGQVVTLVKRDRQSGPTRNDNTYPEPSYFRVDMWYTIWTEDATI